MIERGPLPWELRWTRPGSRSHPSRDVEALVAQLWPDEAFSDVFQVKAGYLLEARAEDGLPLPGGHQDPLLAELTEMVFADLRSTGLLER